MIYSKFSCNQHNKTHCKAGLDSDLFKPFNTVACPCIRKEVKHLNDGDQFSWNPQTDEITIP